MKKVIFLIVIVLPFFGAAQCPDMINVQPEKALWLVPKVQEYYGYELRRSENPFDRSNIVYRDSSGYTRVRINSKSLVTYEGIKKIEAELLTKDILITGPKDKSLLFIAYLRETLKNCVGYKTDAQWIRLKGIVISFHEREGEGGVPLISIFFEAQK